MDKASQSEPQEWISAIAAVQLISLDMGGDAFAKAAIAERILDWVIDVEIEWFAIGADVGPLPHTMPIISDTRFGKGYAEVISQNKESNKRGLLGGAFSLHSADWEKDLRRWHWGKGLFVTTQKPMVVGKSKFPIRQKLPTRFVVYGAHFKSSEILKIAGRTSRIIQDEVNESQKPMAQTRKRRWNYGPVMLQLRELIKDGGMEKKFGHPEERGTLAAIEYFISDYFFTEEGNSPPEATVRSKAQRVRDIWRDFNKYKKD